MLSSIFLLLGIAILIISFLIWWDGRFHWFRNFFLSSSAAQDALEIAHSDEHGYVHKDKDPVVFYMALIPFASFGIWLIYKAFMIKFGGPADPLD